MKISAILLAGGQSKRMGKDKAFLQIKSQIDFVKDVNPYTGPLNGIISCRKKIKNELVFISTCDTPFLQEDIIPYLYKRIDNFDAVIPEINKKKQFLNTIYKRSAVDIGEQLYKKGVRSLYQWINDLKTPEEYERAKVLWREKNT